MTRRILRALAPNLHPTRLPLVRRTLLLLTSLLRPSTLPVRYGFSLYVPRRDRSMYTFHLWRDQVYEPEASELAWNLLRPGDTAIDVGANVGYYTCLYAKRVGTDGQVFAFEPEPRNYEVLRHNVRLNGLSKVIAKSYALSDQPGSRLLYLSEENRGDHTLVELEGRKTLAISAEPFDAFAQREIPEQTIQLLKVDVQGFEISVLRGMQESLAASRIDNLILEYTPYRARLAGDDPAELFDLLQDAKMKCKVISATEPMLSCQALEANVDLLAQQEFAAFDLWLTKDS